MSTAHAFRLAENGTMAQKKTALAGRLSPPGA